MERNVLLGGNSSELYRKLEVRRHHMKDRRQTLGQSSSSKACTWPHRRSCHKEACGELAVTVTAHNQVVIWSLGWIREDRSTELLRLKNVWTSHPNPWHFQISTSQLRNSKKKIPEECPWCFLGRIVYVPSQISRIKELG